MARQLSSGARTQSSKQPDSFYERLVTSALDAIITIDEHSRILLWNPAAEIIFGYTASEAMGEDVARLIIPEEYRKAHHEGLKRLRETGEAPLINRTVEVTALRKDGTMIPVELALFQPDENIPQYTAIVRDISRRKIFETEQRKVAAAIVEDIRNETELGVILQKIVDGVGRLIKADRCAIWFYNAEKGDYEVPYEYRSSEAILSLCDTTLPKPVFADLLARQELVAISDAASYPPITESDLEALKQRKVRGLLHVPLSYHGELLGLMRVHTILPRVWTDDTIEIVRKLAGQAAVAIRHAWIIQEQDKALGRERLVRQVTELASSTLSLETYLGRVTELIGRYFDADRCQAIRYDPERSPDVSWISYCAEGIAPITADMINAEQVYQTSRTMPPGAKLCFSFREPDQAPDFGRNAVEKAGILSAVCLRIDYYGHFFGYLTIHHCRQQKTWTEEEIRFLENLVVHLGNAFFQADLFEKEQAARKQAEEFGERYAVVLEGSNDGLYDWDLVNQTVYWNDRFYEMVGLTRQELPNPGLESFTALIHPDDRPQALAEIQAHLEKTENYAMEYRIRHRDGSYRHVTCRGKSVASPDGQPVRMSGLVRDVTRRKQAEQALRESERRERLKREILETIGDTTDIQQILQSVADRLGTGLGADRASVSRYRHHIREDGTEAFDFDVSAQYCGNETVCQVDPSMVPPEVMRLVALNIPKVYAIKTIAASTRQEYVEDMESRVAELNLDPAHHARILDQLKAFMFERLGVRSHLRVPVEYRGTIYGTITVQHCLNEHRWEPGEIRLVEEIGNYVGGALYQADLLQQEQEARRALEKTNALLSIISDTQSHFITRENIYTLFEKPLNGLLALTNSEYGFIGEVLYNEEGRPYLKCNILSDIAWDEETKALYEEHRLKGMEFHEIDNLFGEVIKTGEVVISNDPDNDPRSAGRPKGHPALRSFLGMPFRKNGRLIGMVGIANRPEGYDASIVEMLQPFLVACANIIEGNRSERLREQMTDELRLNEISLRAYATRLEQSNKDLEDFAVIASHDLQEPLRKIRIFGDRLMSTAGELDENSMVNIERIQAATTRMQDLVSSLLVMSRINRKGRPFAPVDLKTVLNDVIQDNEMRLQETGGRIEVGGTMTISADSTQMRQLFDNLISNALKFHRPGIPPVVRVDMRRDGDRCRITVSDNGIGFEEKYLDRIFEPFRRLHGMGQYPGTGIGLSICRKIAERHGGSILASGKPDEGAVFTITLPIEH